MENALRLLRLIWAAMVSAIVLYVVIAEVIPHLQSPATWMPLQVMAVLSVATVGFLFVLRRAGAKLMAALDAQPEDATRLAHFRAVSIVTFALCEMIALYGFILRMLGYTLTQVAYFYIAGMAILLLAAPRRSKLFDVASS
jgi:hypothetical protein